MTYNPNIPQASDDPGQSQSQMLTNFGKIASSMAVNHVPLTSGGFNGFHTKVQFPDGISEPAPTGTESILFPFTVSGKVQLVFKNATQRFQLTGLPIVTPGAGSATDYGVVTPWGLTINFGTKIISGSNTGVTTFAIPFSQVISCLASPTTVQGVLAITPENDKVTYTFQGTPSLTINYFAIGLT